MIAYIWSIHVLLLPKKRAKVQNICNICKYPLKNSQLFFTNLSGCEVEFASWVLLGPDDIVG